MRIHVDAYYVLLIDVSKARKSIGKAKEREGVMYIFIGMYFDWNHFFFVLGSCVLVSLVFFPLRFMLLVHDVGIIS
jgi:hypothetical protein